MAFYFSSEGRKDLLEYILKCGANINIKHHQNSKNPLIISAEKGHINILNLLNENNAEFRSKDHRNDNLVNWAVYKNNIDYLIAVYNLLKEKYKHNPLIIKEIFNNHINKIFGNSNLELLHEMVPEEHKTTKLFTVENDQDSWLHKMMYNIDPVYSLSEKNTVPGLFINTYNKFISLLSKEFFKENLVYQKTLSDIICIA